MARFSKETLAKYLQHRLQFTQKDWGFDPACGTSQIPHVAKDRERTNPMDYIPPGETSEYHHLEEALRAYGAVSALMAVADHFELSEVSEIAGMLPTRVGPLKQYKRYRPAPKPEC